MPPAPPCPHRRRALRVLAAAAPLTGLAWPGRARAQPAAPAAALRIALAPFLSPAALLAAYRPLREHLESALGRTVQMVTERDFRTLADAAQRGAHDVMQLPAHMARLAMVDWRWQQVAGVQDPVGAVVVAKAGGPVASPADLRGRRVGMLDPLSLTATLGRRWLQQQGLDADTTVLTQPSVNSGMYALDRGEVAALVCSDSQLKSLPPGTPRGERVLAALGEIPAPVFVARPGWPATEVAALRAAMVAFRPDPARPLTASNALLRPLDEGRLAAMDPLVPLLRQVLGR